MPDPMFASDLADEISQGDVFNGIEVVDRFDPSSANPTRVVLLTNDCDIDKPNHKVAHVVRLVAIADVPADKADVIAQIRADQTPAAMLVPPAGPLPESFIDFRTIHRIEKAQIFEASRRGDRIASMSGDGRLALFHRLYTYFRRVQPRKKKGEPTPKVQVVTPETDLPR